MHTEPAMEAVGGRSPEAGVLSPSLWLGIALRFWAPSHSECLCSKWAEVIPQVAEEGWDSWHLPQNGGIPGLPVTLSCFLGFPGN